MTQKTIPPNWQYYLLILLAWMVTRAYPLITMEPSLDWQVWESKKLLEYGFSERQGGIINFHFMTGRVADPEKFNYVNHPYPILWLDTLAYYTAGEWGPIVFTSFLGLLSCLAVLPALSTFLPTRESFAGALLYTLAPSSIFFNVNANTVSLGAIIWPFAILFIGRQLHHKSPGSYLPLGVIAFLGGQISWFTYTVMPALLSTCLGLNYERGKGFNINPGRKTAAALLIGGLATAMVFAAQVIHYTHDMAADIAYFHGQAGAQEGVSTAKMYLAIGLRAVMSVGPSLALGALLWMALRLRSGSLRWYELSALLYLVTFALSSLILRRFFFREIHMYQYLVFPCTVLTMASLHSLGRPLWTRLTLLLALVAVSYPMIKSSIPMASQTTRTLGRYIAEISKPTDVIATNLESRRPPFASWDVGSIELLNVFSDRLIREGIGTRKAIDALPSNFKSNELDVVFLYNPALPIDPSFLEDLQNISTPDSHRFQIPDEPATFGTSLRNFYWKLSGRHQLSQNETTAGKETEAQIDIFRIRLVKDASTAVTLLPATK